MTNPAKTRPKKDYSPDKVIERLDIKVLPPEENDNYFKDIIGNKAIINHFKALASKINSKKELVIRGVPYHHGYLLLGSAGVGKTLTVFSFAKEINRTIIVINIERLISDYSDEMFAALHEIIESHNPCVVFFKELCYTGELDEGQSSTPLYVGICKLRKSFPESFFFTSSSYPFLYPPFFDNKGEGFDKRFSFRNPDPQERVLLIKKIITDSPYDPKLDFKKLARILYGFTGGDICNLLEEAHEQAYLTGKKFITFELISDIAYSKELGDKNSKKMKEQDMLMTAYHEAGHAVAGYFGFKNYIITKIEIAERSRSLGVTDGSTDEEIRHLSREDIIGDIRTDLGGKAAEKIKYGSNGAGVCSDMQHARALAMAYVRYYGMDDNIQAYLSEESGAIIDIATQKEVELLNREYIETIIILCMHWEKVEALVKALMANETLYEDEVRRILEGKDKKKKPSNREKNSGDKKDGKSSPSSKEPAPSNLLDG